MTSQAGQSETIVHASCVAVDGKGLLILGRSGAGKSALALQLMALGALLVSDDQTLLNLQAGKVFARCPTSLRGLIEARGIGILTAPPLESAAIALVVDLGQSAHERLPPRRKIVMLGQEIDLVLAPQGNHFSAALLCYLKGSRQD